MKSNEMKLNYTLSEKGGESRSRSLYYFIDSRSIEMSEYVQKYRMIVTKSSTYSYYTSELLSKAEG
jgi:hypothetical protein